MNKDDLSEWIKFFITSAAVIFVMVAIGANYWFYFGSAFLPRFAAVPFWRGIFLIRLPPLAFTTIVLLIIYVVTSRLLDRRTAIKYTSIVAGLFAIFFFLTWLGVQIFLAAL
jgi:hypothetical protein